MCLRFSQKLALGPFFLGLLDAAALEIRNTLAKGSQSQVQERADNNNNIVVVVVVAVVVYDTSVVAVV